MNTFSQEVIWLWAGSGCYAITGVAAARGVALRRETDGWTLGWLVAGLFLIGIAIGQRWLRTGHGPFLSMFEILLSNAFSLGLIFALAYWRLPRLRPVAVVIMPILLLLAVWMLSLKPHDTHLPATYETPVLWLHVLAGKGFLGLCMVAVGLASVILLRGHDASAKWFSRMPSTQTLDDWAWRFLFGAMVFETLMLIAGALWAQDAWGRYWAWDPLETWAFLTWIVAVASVHARLAYHFSPSRGALLIIAVFVLAFLAFFGVPFISLAPHKGAV